MITMVIKHVSVRHGMILGVAKKHWGDPPCGCNRHMGWLGWLRGGWIMVDDSKL